MKPFAESCETNKYPILEVIRNEFSDCNELLEIGSGTGQHAVFFTQALAHLSWQPSEQKENLLGIQMWLNDFPQPNALAPVILDVCGKWPNKQFDAAFSANTTHIMSWPQVQCLFSGLGHALKADSPFCLYGPFNFNRQFTSESNALFDQRLRQRDPKSGIRNFEDLDRLANDNGLIFKKDYPVPMNNRILVWVKK